LRRLERPEDSVLGDRAQASVAPVDDLCGEALQLARDELVEAALLEVRPASLGRAGAGLELARLLAARTEAAGEAFAVDERLHAELDLSVDMSKDRREVAPALVQEPTQLRLAAVDGAKPERHDGRARQHVLQHLLVRADLPFEPRRIVQQLGQAGVVEL